MIEKMKKATLLIYHSSKDKFLSELQNLGVMHLETNSAVQTESILEIKERIVRLTKAKKILSEYVDKKELAKRNIEVDSDLNLFLTQFEADKAKLDSLYTEKEALKKEYLAVLPYGSFDKNVLKEIASQGINIKVFCCSKKAFAKVDRTKIYCEEIYADGTEVYFVVFYSNDEELKAIEKIGIEEKIPERNKEEIQKREKAIEEAILQIEKAMTEYTSYLPLINQKLMVYEDELHYQLADASLIGEVDGKVLVITGYFPETISMKVKEFLDKEDVAYLIDDPQFGENAPVKLRNNKFAKLFEPVGSLFSLPDYFELDVVPFFAPFFAFYFGLCLGDVGYGIVICLIAFIALLNVKNKSLKGILKLGIILGVCTGLGGFMLNSFFGTNIVTLDPVNGNVNANISIFEPLKEYVTFNNSNDRTGPMIFAILLGVIQLFLGYLINAYNRVKSYGIQGIFQPIGTICIMMGAVVLVMLWMYKPTVSHPFHDFVVGPIPLGRWLMALGGGDQAKLTLTLWILVFAGIGLVLLFNNVEKKFFIRPVIGLWELYNVATGLLSDLLSYIRLFALGLAGGLLGTAFNDIALMVKNAFPGGIVVMVIIMVVGHTLNFLLSAIGAFVHPLRLTFVEFYKAVGFTGGGKPFVPFSNRNIQK